MKNLGKLLHLFAIISIVKSETVLRFPENFKFGVSTSAYQIEGAWNVDGKTPSVWDFYTHNLPDKIEDGSNGDVACDSYNNIDEDVKNIKKLNVDFYRFSISWSRIHSHGFNNTVNQKGIDYYDKLIDKLMENKITPVVTMYQGDLPQGLHELGGFTNPLIVDYFSNYARVLFSKFGDRVKTWITLNEPTIVCNYGYGDGLTVPYYTSDYIGRYLCGHHQLLIHAKVYDLYQKEFKKQQNGMVGISLESGWYEPASSSKKDIEAAERMMDFSAGWFLNPLTHGDYPDTMRKRIDKNSESEGFGVSRLPKFSENEKMLLKYSFDFLGLNHYTTFLAFDNPDYDIIPSFNHDHMVNLTQNPSWKGSARDQFKLVPWGMRKVLNWIKDKYNNPQVIITENGYAGFQNDTVHDVDRQEYMIKYLNETLKAVVLDGCNVIGYSAWTLMDNYEWSAGYTLRFGLYHVDFSTPEKVRTPKESASLYTEIIKSRKIPV